MKLERRVIDEAKKIIQITTEDERWYSKEVKDKIVYVPSVTWIVSYYPKGVAYFKWLANHGWDEAEAIKKEAGEKGSKVHQGIDFLLSGGVITPKTRLVNHEKGAEEELSVDEYGCIMSFVEWFEKTKPEVLATELTVFSDNNTYAGTVDLICKIDGEEWVIDYKTSQDIWPSHRIQVSAYARAVGGNFRLWILQLGYNRNLNKYKFTELEDQFELFEAARLIWASETAGVVPLQRDFPLELKLTLTKKGVSNGNTGA